MYNMKKYFVAAVFALFVSGAQAQIKVPAEVAQAFAKDHPGKTASWKEDDKNFKASFKTDDKETVVLYSAAGSLIQTEDEMDVSTLPSAITNYATFQRWGAIKKASKITTSVGIVSYYIQIKDGNAIFNEKGNFLRFAKD